MTNAWTKGPWFAVQYANRSIAWRVTQTPDDAHGDIANILAGLAARTTIDVEANARLIAAAPDMAEALMAIVWFCDDPDGSEQPETLAMGLGRLLPAARAALQKARGETP